MEGRGCCFREAGQRRLLRGGAGSRGLKEVGPHGLAGKSLLGGGNKCKGPALRPGLVSFRCNRKASEARVE